MTAISSPMVTTDPKTATMRSSAPPHEVAPDLLLYASSSNTYTLRTEAGLLLIDPGLRQNSQSVYSAVRAWSQAPLHTVVYTHGHPDHAFGLRAFLDAGERPQIIAQENCPRHFQRYHLTNGLNTFINQRQFGNPNFVFPDQFDWPTLTFKETLMQVLGNVEVYYHSAKGETDDHCYLWIPGRSYLFSGDLIGWIAPNCGNPQKVQRYPVEWAESLERMASLDAEWLFPGHGLVVHGREAVRTLLLETAQYLHVIIDQVLTRMNSGQTPEEIFHAVEPDPELSIRPYLQATYDHPKFIVRNLLRQWGGWWNGNAADLLPSPLIVQAQEIAYLAGGVAVLVKHGRMLLQQGNIVLATHLAEWATLASPMDLDAQAFKRDVYAKRLEESRALMAQGIFRAAMNDAREVLGEDKIIPSGGQ
jgi:glyoxylase-like metal-dependent hydrolase (beta-lactamase superfamily II)